MARVAEIQAASRLDRSAVDLTLLLPYMAHRRVPQGTVLFKAGDPASDLFYLQRGVVRLLENGVEIQERSIFGELGLFAPSHARTCTAACVTAVELFTIESERIHQLTVIDPAFAWLVLKLVSEHLYADIRRLTGHAVRDVV
jgi:CRP-like cAMP-binding protein